MIETWRQCCSAAYTGKGVTDPGYFVVGPFRGGGFIKELRLTVTAERTTSAIFSASVSGTDEATLEALQAGTPVVGRTDLGDANFGGAFWGGGGQSFAGDVVIPMWFLVDAHGRYVVIGVNPLPPQEVYVLATVTVVGVARMGANGWGVEDGLDK